MTQILSMKDCIQVVKSVLEELAMGRTTLPLRSKVTQNGANGVLALMPGGLTQLELFGLKAITAFPKNRVTQYESHQGAVLLFETKNGVLLSVVDASSVTAIRTGAASGLATDILARKDASSLAILGSGTQASMHLDAMLVVRDGIKKIAVWSRTPDHARGFAESESKRIGKGIKVVKNAEDAVVDADIVCTTTASTTPILFGKWLKSGTHVNAVGASVPTFRELDNEAVARSKLYTDRKESLLNESDDFLIPLKEGIINQNHLKGELGDVLMGRVAGRSSPNEITLFKSLGIAVEDIAAAHYVFSKAKSSNLGTWIEFNGNRDSPKHNT